jgi:GTPase SAR1 family protein
MNGMNKTIVTVVSIIALAYAGWCFALSLYGFDTSGVIHIYLMLPHVIITDGIDAVTYLTTGTDFTQVMIDSIPGYSSAFSTGLYDGIVDGIIGVFNFSGTTNYYAKMFILMVGFVLSLGGFLARPSLDCKGRTNPAEYLWTHRPNAFLRCIAMPWNMIVGAWQKSKPLVIIPLILAVFFFPWAILVSASLVIPFLIVRLVIGMQIKSAAEKEEKEYSRNTEFGVCPNCKRNFDRPMIKCRCGLILDYPVPNIYGYKYHTCNRGHEIPCLSGRRGNLTTICPHCNQKIETREALPITISLVGGTGTGKTTLMLAAVRTISGQARLVDITTDCPSSGLTKDALAAKDYAPKTIAGELESQIVFLRSMKLQDREIVFNDISGVEFQPSTDKVIFEEYYNYTNGIIFTFDPLSLTREIKKETPSEVFESFHYMYTMVRNIGPGTVSDVPFAIVSTKADLMKTPLRDEGVRQYLIDNGEEGFVRVVESLFKEVKYFSVCSFGDECESAMRPVWWIVGHADKKLTDIVQCP